MNFLYLSLGGILGVGCRYGVTRVAFSILGPSFHYGTLIVNTTGCLAIGFLATLAEERWYLSHGMRGFIFVGFLGAYTTFSTYMYDSYKLIELGQVYAGLVNLVISVLLGFAALCTGVFLARLY